MTSTSERRDLDLRAQHRRRGVKLRARRRVRPGSRFDEEDAQGEPGRQSEEHMPQLNRPYADPPARAQSVGSAGAAVRGLLRGANQRARGHSYQARPRGLAPRAVLGQWCGSWLRAHMSHVHGVAVAVLSAQPLCRRWSAWYMEYCMPQSRAMHCVWFVRHPIGLRYL